MIETTYTLAEEDFQEASKLWCKKEVKKLPGHALVLALAGIFGVFMGMGLSKLPPWHTLAFALIMLTWVLLSKWRRKAIAHRQFEMKGTESRDIRIRIDDTGYSDEKTDSCGGWINWPGFSGWRETPRIFVLGRQLQFVTIPKSGLTSEQQNDLRALLQAKLGPAL